MKEIRVRKINPDGSVKIEYRGTVREDTSELISIDTGWSREELDLGYVVFKPEDRWIETFYRDGWYNVFRIGDAEGNLKGFYMNVTKPPRIEDGFIDWEDLALDIWVRPDGSYIILDEDEFHDLDLDGDTREKAMIALNEMIGMIRNRDGPLGELEMTFCLEKNRKL